MDIEEHPLAWRWTSSTHAALPSDVLSSMRALSSERAALLTKHGLEALNRGSRNPSLRYRTEDVESTRKWLSKVPGVSHDAFVEVIWSDSIGIALPWNAFVRYWDDFCYPSSDDIFILSDNPSVMLAYFHTEEFEVIAGVA
jgi:hypothetical protein